MLKVTFKKWEKLTGLAAIGYSHQSVDIKINKMQVGTIYAPNWQTEDDKWGISFMVDDATGSRWDWITLKARFDTEEEARTFVKTNIDAIAKKYTLHYVEK